MVQALLSARLIWANTAFLDEGTYIWAGRVELWHAVDGTSVPDYASYFSGAPTIYPPLAGIADILGGLTAVRLLSLAFMLGVTGMLWGTARSLFGQRVALSAVALFVTIGPTQFLGALATYDAMGLFLLTFEGSWPDTTPVVAAFRGLAREYPGPYLAEDEQAMGYYLEDELPWQDWTDTWYLSYSEPGGGRCAAGSTSRVSLATLGSSAVGKALVSAIRHQYYSLIMLDFGDTQAVDQVITSAIHRYRTYHLVAQVAGADRFGGSKYLIWAPTPAVAGATGASC